MQYRYLGPTGLRVSVISYGNWVNSNSQEVKQLTIDCVKEAWDLGVNFFDTAEVYGFGEAERQIGDALRALNVPRHHLVISTKIYWNRKENLPNTRGLSRKHVIEGARSSLKKLGFPYVDVIFCHRPDEQTPIEETCRAFDWLIRKGYAFYWGTSEWSAAQFADALAICEKYHLIKPVVEQCQYNIYTRQKMEAEYKWLFEQKLMGTTIWSPLLGGILTGKYNDGVPEGSRVTNSEVGVFYKEHMVDKKEDTLSRLKKMAELAKELGCSMAQLAMAWCIKNPDVSTAITGASRKGQLSDTCQALDVLPKLTHEVQNKIEAIFENEPVGKFNFTTFQNDKSRRRDILGY